MSIVTLVSGGLDSTLVALLTHESDILQHPLFIDYGQRAKERELDACRRSLARIGLPPPEVADLAGFGGLVHSGLTDARLHVRDRAFTPGRNMLFLLIGASYAHVVGADAVSIGLLHEDSSLFPDQTAAFLSKAEDMLSLCLGRTLRVLAPLAEFHKRDVVQLAKEKGLHGTYSCHVGDEQPCGECIACREFFFGEE